MFLEKYLKLFPSIAILSIVLTVSCTDFALHQSNARMSHVFARTSARSVLDCAAMAENNITTVSFSYYSDKKTCELSGVYPDGFTFHAENWKVFYKIGKKNKYFPLYETHRAFFFLKRHYAHQGINCQRRAKNKTNSY